MIDMKRTRSGLMAALALAATASLTLAGCTGQGGLKFSDVPSADTTITVWSPAPGASDASGEAYQAIVDAFTDEYPQVKVDLVPVAADVYDAKLAQSIEDQQGPDVISLFGGAQAYGYRDAVWPLQEAIDPDFADELRFVGDNVSTDGNLYMIPVGSYGTGLLVNTDLFTEAGLKPAEALASWNALLESCPVLIEHKIKPFGSGWQDGVQLEILLRIFSSQLMDDDALVQWTSGELSLTDEVFVKALDHVSELSEAGCFGNDTALEASMYDDAFNQYYTGRAAMLLSGDLSTGERALESIPESTVMPMPAVPGAARESTLEAGALGGWSVTRWTKNPEASVAFVNFLASPAGQQILWDQLGVVPNLDGLELETSDALQEAYLPLVQNGENRSTFPSFSSSALAEIRAGAPAFISGELTAAKLLEGAAPAGSTSE